jgi:hypothetical protein
MSDFDEKKSRNMKKSKEIKFSAERNNNQTNK